MLIRNENAADIGAIAALTSAAFATAPHASGTEAAIVSGLRRAGVLSLSLVAEAEGVVLGHVAASPATVGGQAGWACIGPISVLPDRQGQGIGSALMRAALDQLRGLGEPGAVLVGDPAYYHRFGFRPYPGLAAAGIPGDYVLGLPFGAELPRGRITFHPAFGVS